MSNTKTKSVIKEKVKDVCDKCSNPMILGGFYFEFSKIKVWLCKNCWIGFAVGIREDLNIYERSGEVSFIDSMKKTKEIMGKTK